MARTKVRAETQIRNAVASGGHYFLRADGSISLEGDFDVGGNRITELPNPVDPQDILTKSYTDNALLGVDKKESARVATVQNIDLSSPPDIVDTVDTSQGDRILVHNQSDASENGIYDVSVEARAESSETVFSSTDIDDPVVAVERVTGGVDIKHYAFVDNETGDIRYAVKDGQTWSVEIVANQTGSIDLALDGSTPHIIAEIGGIQYHFVRDGGSWTSMNGFTSPTLHEPSIDVDSSGGLHICGAEGGTGNALGYANKTNTTWSQETADSNAQTQSSDIVLDSADNIHVAYRDDSTSSGKYAFYDGTWTTETYSQSTENDGQLCGIDVDPSDSPHISHYGDLAIWHSYLSSGTWNTDKVTGIGRMENDPLSTSISFNYLDWDINTTTWDIVEPVLEITAKDVESKSLNYVGYDLNTTSWTIEGSTLQITSKDIETREFNYNNYELNTTTWS